MAAEGGATDEGAASADTSASDETTAAGEGSAAGASSEADMLLVSLQHLKFRIPTGLGFLWFRIAGLRDISVPR